jgi:hypothetical protein
VQGQSGRWWWDGDVVSQPRPVGTATVFGQATPGGWLTLTFRRYNKSPVAVGDVAPVAHRAHSRSCSADADHGNLFGRLDGISRTWPR